MSKLSTKSKPEQINERLFDLCRYQRGGAAGDAAVFYAAKKGSRIAKLNIRKS